jgi:hypothetical protein
MIEDDGRRRDSWGREKKDGEEVRWFRRRWLGEEKRWLGR